MNPKLCVIPLILIGAVKTILNSVIGALMISQKYSSSYRKEDDFFC